MRLSNHSPGQHVWRPHVNQNLDRNQPEPPVMNGGAERLTYEMRVRGELTEALMTNRWRWSLSERPQSFITFVGSVGELKNASPRSFMDFDSA